jgi:SAM-dependent MidA family methyltransferase
MVVDAEPVPWQDAWQSALYGPQGFYRRAEGPAGHFATSAQGLPHGTALLARAVVTLARRHGLTHVVDVGAGRGELASAVAELLPALRVTAVDVVDRPPGVAPSVGWVRSPGGAALPDSLTGLGDALVLAHEWLDVVPCTVVTREDGVWRVLTVEPRTGHESVDGRPSADEAAWLDRWAGPSALRAEVGLTRDLAWADLVSRVDDGLVLAVDYGHTLADRPPEGTLTAYRHGAQVVPVPDGSCDLTAHVAVDALAAATPGAGVRVLRQREVLEDLLGPPRAAPHDLARSDPTAYLEALAEQSTRRELAAPDGLGGFWWVLAERGTTVGA